MADGYKDKIIAFYRRTRRMPSYSEIMSMLGFKSKNAVFKLVGRLIEEGVLGKDSRGRLIPNALAGEVPLLGVVEAGFPTIAEEQALDTMSIDEYLMEGSDRTYLLEVKGDSMIEAGIREGDLVLAEKGKEARDGDIVIAEVDGGWTMKYLRTKGGRAWLEPANRKYRPIYPENGMTIAAVVKGVVRKY
ncbi:MAG: transcriptional repressor LexA [Patescibacteria group bacterium]|nr:transcriptional repressor LexA [Patescibacteria group bacterium]